MTQRQQELVNNNLKLVYSITSKFSVPAADREDLVQEAIESLCMAAQRYDPTRGEKFVTYAYAYISGRCKYFVSRNAIIKPTRTRATNYKKFETYEVSCLDDYLFLSDQDATVEVSEVETLLKNILHTHGKIALNVCKLLYKGYNTREISKQLGIKYSQVLAIIQELKNDEILLQLFKEQ